MKYCPHCMNPVQGTGSKCSCCGGDLQWKGGQEQLPVGTTLSSQRVGHIYMVGAAIGQGGFGITYVGMDLADRNKVAIKEYFPTICCQRPFGTEVLPKPGKEEYYKNSISKFLKEGQILAALEPLPFVVKIYDFFEANNTAYLVMEFLDGETLSRKTLREGKLSPREILPKFATLTEDIIKLHQAGIIHRDISPDNIMWMKDGTLKLLDFGCARSLAADNMTVLLKPGFAPVEQYLTKGQGPGTDVYALAATIYYCLSGNIPQTALDRLENDELEPLISQGVDITPAEEKALLWGLEVQPKSRPENMEIFANALFTRKVPEVKVIKKVEEPWIEPQKDEGKKNEEKKHFDKKMGVILLGGLLVLFILLLILFFSMR